MPAIYTTKVMNFIRKKMAADVLIESQRESKEMSPLQQYKGTGQGNNKE